MNRSAPDCIFADRRAPRPRTPLLLLALLLVPAAAAQTADDLFDDRVLHEVRLNVHPADWQRLIDHYLDNTYYPCTFTWRGLAVEDVGIRSRGLGSRNATKPGLRVDFNRFAPGQQFLGLKSVILDNHTQDPSMLRERIAMLLFRRLSLPAPREAHTRLYINGVYAGLYSLVESVDKAFLKHNFGEDDGYLYEYDWAENYYFNYRGPDPARYSPVPFKPETHEQDPDPKPLEAMVRAINQASDAGFASAVGQFLDLKATLTHVAVENFIAEIDGILGNWGINNFYLYRFERKNLHQFIAWDKDVTFQSADHPIWRNTGENVLVRRALAVPELRDAYLDALYRAAAAADGWLDEEVRRAYSQIREAARADSRKPYSNDDFEASVEGMFIFARERGDFVRREVEAAGFRPGPPSLAQGGVVIAAPGGSTVLAPGALATVYGERLAASIAIARAFPLPAELAGFSLRVNGIPAPLLYVSPGQVNFQVPWEISPGPATLTAARDGVASNTITTAVEPASPGIFVIVHADGRLVSAQSPAAPGDVLVLYATGLGPVTRAVSSGRPAPLDPLVWTSEMPRVTIAGLAAEVSFSGLTPEFAGLYQVNLRVPTGVSASPPPTLQLTIAGRPAAPVALATR